MKPRVIIVGAGFGGLYAARTLAGKNADVTLIDRYNYHTFTPLLYQVATCSLDPGEIAYPIRGIFRGHSNVRFLLGEVTTINTNARSITVRTNAEQEELAYDYLIIAAGSITNYWGMTQVAAHAFGLKTVSEAVMLRNHILKLFEKASWTDNPTERQALMTFVVVGGGPTGLETAGALYELYNHVLQKEYPDLKDVRARVVLVEATNDLLAPFPEKLRKSALKQIKSLGVEAILGQSVITAAPTEIQLSDGQTIATHTLIWTAGVKASPLAEMLNVSLQRGGRVPISEHLEVTGADRVYVVGDMAYLEDNEGTPYPALIPVAKQQGILAAKNILRRETGESVKPFRYHDRGIMATIGRSRAVAWIYNRIALSGYVAWVGWLILHLITLMGFRNRLNVFMNWVWNYLTFDHSVRIILEHRRQPANGALYTTSIHQEGEHS